MRIPFLCGLLLVLAAAGCSNSQNATVTGTVTLDGQPLTTGAVTFSPVKEGPVVVGNIQPDGSYTVQTGDETGLAAGEYRVTVVATSPTPEATAENPEPLPQLLTPARYGDPATSGLQYTVKLGENRFNIPLTSQ